MMEINGAQQYSKGLRRVVYAMLDNNMSFKDLLAFVKVKRDLPPVHERKHGLR
jgi:hypothetical protein